MIQLSILILPLPNTHVCNLHPWCPSLLSTLTHTHTHILSVFWTSLLLAPWGCVMLKGSLTGDHPAVCLLAWLLQHVHRSKCWAPPACKHRGIQPTETKHQVVSIKSTTPSTQMDMGPQWVASHQTTSLLSFSMYVYFSIHLSAVYLCLSILSVFLSPCTKLIVRQVKSSSPHSRTIHPDCFSISGQEPDRH